MDQDLVSIITVYLAIMVFLFFFNKAIFWKWLIISALVVAIIIIFIRIYRMMKSKLFIKHMDEIYEKIGVLKLEDDIDDFINRFGRGSDKGTKIFKYRGYSFEKHRLYDFQDLLEDKGLSIDLSDLNRILRDYIEKKEKKITKGSIGTQQYQFLKLTGQDFEKLLCRLFEAMGYTVQLVGKSGDQGGDLIANKVEERILIQAKRYTNADTVGNEAIQQAVAAKKYYDCNKCMVVTCSSFTPAAIELAKVDEVELIAKERLQELLLQYLKESWL